MIRCERRGFGFRGGLAFFLVFMGACSSPESRPEPVPVLRYENALMELDTADMRVGLEEIASSYPLFFDGVDLQDTLNLWQLRNFIEDPVVRLLHARIQEQYDADSLRLGISLAGLFREMHRLDPSFRNPVVYTYISYLDHPNRVFFMDSVLVVGLDLYIDGNQNLMDEYGIPRYISQRLNSAYLLPDAARILVMSRLDAPEEGCLLDYIAWEGKIQYALHHVLPDEPDFVLFGYTEAQMDWCRKNEGLVWDYLVSQGLLFETDPFEFRYFVNEGPFNPLLPGAPARLAQFVGWRMVEAYMRKSDADWNALRQADARTLLEVSRYKP